MVLVACLAFLVLVALWLVLPGGSGEPAPAPERRPAREANAPA
jgi:predicted MFS family arabinose efflux permease